jgi:hypothetical protein
MEIGVSSTLINNKHQSRREREDHEEKTKPETTPRSEKGEKHPPHNCWLLRFQSLIAY